MGGMALLLRLLCPARNIFAAVNEGRSICWFAIISNTLRHTNVVDVFFIHVVLGHYEFAVDLI